MNVIKPLILDTKNKIRLCDVKIWRHDVIYRYTAKMWRHKLENCITIEPGLVESWLTPHFFHYPMEKRFWNFICKFTHILYENMPKMSIMTLSDVIWRHNVRFS